MTKKKKTKSESVTSTENKVLEIVNDAAEKILEGVQGMFDEQNVINDKKFATKEDLKQFATTDDLKREIGFVRQDVIDLKAEISTNPSRTEFETLKRKVNRLAN